MSRLLGEDSRISEERVKGRKLIVDTDLQIPDHKVATIGDFIGFCCTCKRWSFRKIRTRFAGDHS